VISLFPVTDIKCDHNIHYSQVLVSSGLEAKFAGLGLELSGLGLAFKQDQDLINFYCAISATKL